MTDISVILEQLTLEKDLAFTRIRILDEVIDIIQSGGLSNDNIEHLVAFLNATKSFQRGKKILQISSKMNDHADLLKQYLGFDETKNVKDKIVIILKTQKHFLSVREIGEILLKLDLSSSSKVQDYVKNISPVLSNMAKNKDRICKVSNDGNKKSTMWGLLEWMQNGKLVKDF